MILGVIVGVGVRENTSKEGDNLCIYVVSK